MKASSFALLFWLLLTPVAHACISSGDPWFESDISIDQNNFPAGVVVSDEVNRDTEGKPLDHYPVIDNTTDTPLIFVGAPVDPGCPAYLRHGVPPELAAIGIHPGACDEIIKFQHDNLYTDSSTTEGEWNWEKYYDPHLFADEMYYFGARYASCIDGDPYCGMFKDRPDNVQVPSSTPFVLHAYFGEKLITIAGTTTYRLKPNYISYSHAVSCSHTDRINIAAIIIGLIAGAFFVFLSWFRKRGSRVRNGVSHH